MVDRLFTAFLLEAGTAANLWGRVSQTFGDGKKIFAEVCTAKVGLGMYIDGNVFGC